MTDLLIRQGPLASLGLAGRAREGLGEAEVGLSERTFAAITDLRGNPEDADFLGTVQGTLGLELPLEPLTSGTAKGRSALWIGPDQWWIVDEDAKAESAAKLRAALDGTTAAITEIGESRARIGVTGPRARDLLAKACPLDLHESVFTPGNCTGSGLAKTQGLIHQTGKAPSYDLYVLRSFAVYLWHWLEDAGREYGVAVVR